MVYPYVPLDATTPEIRTLTIAPSDDHYTKICSSINAACLSSETVHYEALSYVWGSVKEKVTIDIDGHPFSITRNLATALRYLRKPNETRTLWVDAVCINQNDIHERNVQVRRMGSIYSQASRVLIWLGDRDADVEATMSKLQDTDALKDKLYDNFPRDIAEGLQTILQKKWWHRVWTLQELILADRDPLVGCGQTWLEWEKLSRAILDYTTTMMDGKEGMIMDENSSWATNAFEINRHILLRKQWKEREHLESRKGTVHEMIERTRGYQCTNPRDQVYGIRDLICDEEKAFYPVPDYDKSVSEVYQEAMMSVFRSKKNLTFLIHAVQSNEDRDALLPSWCADFSQRIWDMGAYDNINPLGSSEDNEDETKDLARMFSHDPINNALKVQGSFLGKAILARPLIPAAAWEEQGVMAAEASQNEIRLLPREEASKLWILTELVKEVLRKSTIAAKCWESRFGKEKAKERLAEGIVWRTAYGGHLLFTAVDAACVRAGVERVTGEDRPYDYWNVEAYIRESFPWYADALKAVDLFHPTSDLPDSTRLRRGLWESLLVVMQMNRDAWWSGTDTGYIFRASREVKENDQLCEITGCKLPMILRPREDDAHELICLAESDEFHEDHYHTHRDEAEGRELVLK